MESEIKTRIKDVELSASELLNYSFSGWNTSIDGELNKKVIVRKQRNEFVFHVIKKRTKTNYALDIGCGIGDLVFKMGKIGISVTGIDLVQSMIDIAHRRLAKNKAEMVKFVTNDFFDWHVESETYDLIVANGFVDNISFVQRDNFFNDAWRGLVSGGSLIISSRNRLFNLFALNDNSISEFVNDSYKALLLEAIALGQGESLNSLLELNCALLPEKNLNTLKGKTKIATLHYTPVQLMQLLGNVGFDIEEISPVHIHSMLPANELKHIKMHNLIAINLQEVAMGDQKFIPQASTFMIHARKR